MSRAADDAQAELEEMADALADAVRAYLADRTVPNRRFMELAVEGYDAASDALNRAVAAEAESEGDGHRPQPWPNTPNATERGPWSE